MATIDKRPNGKYRVRIRKPGYPGRTKTFTRKTDAEVWARQLESRIDKGQTIPDQEASRRTLKDAIERYVRDVAPHLGRNKNWKNKKRHLEWWKEKYGRYSLSALTPAVIVEARDKLNSTMYTRKGPKGTTVEKPRTPRTTNTYLVSLSSVLSTAQDEWLWIESNPLEKVRKLTEPRGRVRFLSDDERKRLLEACRETTSPTLYPVVIIALSTGMRQGEVLGMTWDRVDTAKGRIVIEETKNGERRTVPLAGHALEVLREYRRLHRRVGTPLVFPDQIGQRPTAVRQAWYSAVERAGLKDFRFHDLRHSAASYLAMNGATLTEIADVLGHKTLAMVKRYSHLTEQHTAAVVSRMNKAVFGDG